MISVAVLHKYFTSYPCYLVLLFQLNSMKNNCLILRAVLIFWLTVKFSSFNCFKMMYFKLWEYFMCLYLTLINFYWWLNVINIIYQQILQIIVIIILYMHFKSPQMKSRTTRINEIYLHSQLRSYIAHKNLCSYIECAPTAQCMVLIFTLVI